MACVPIIKLVCPVAPEEPGASSDDFTAFDTGLAAATETGTPELPGSLGLDPYQLASGDYVVNELATTTNECGADLSHMKGQAIPVTVSDGRVEVANYPLTHTGNLLRAQLAETIEWEGLNWSCSTEITNVITGSVYGDNAFELTWSVTWGLIEGDVDQCEAALSITLPCTYASTMDLLYVED